MKNILLSGLTLLMFVITGCDKDDDVTSSITPAAVKSTIIAGTWRVTYFYNDGENKTTNFSGYNFTFNTNGTVAAVNDILSVPGTWSALTDDNKTKLLITFNNPATFQEISEDWHVTERSDTRVKLVDDGNTAEQLIFERN